MSLRKLFGLDGHLEKSPVVSEEDKTDELCQFEFPEPRKPLPSSEYKWKTVRGYKATDVDMKSFYGGVTFELGVPCEEKETVIPCQQGYHFCMNLEDVLEMFPPILGRRYFEVEAEVLCSEYESGGKIFISIPDCAALEFMRERKEHSDRAPGSSFYRTCLGQKNPLAKKYVGRTMTLLREIPFEDYSSKVSFYIKDQETYRSLSSYGMVHNFLHQKWREVSKEVFSEGFSAYLFNTEIPARLVSSDPRENSLRAADTNFKKMVDAIEAIKQEDVSQDVKVLFVMNYLGLIKT